MRRAVAFLRWLVELLQQLAGRSGLGAAVLADEGAGDPTCPIEAGWIYVYRWAGVGEPTDDAAFARVALRPTS